MPDKNIAEALHDKSTRGGALTEAEQAALETGYAREDAEEAAQLAASSAPSPALATLRAEVAAATRQLNGITQRIQTQSDENEKLRQENAALSQRLIENSSQTVIS